MRLLFVCSASLLRSPTAEAVFSALHGVEALSAGTNHDAETPVSADLIEWADAIFAMERTHRVKLQKKFGRLLRTKKVVVLDIPDDYKYMDLELIQILKQRVSPYLRISSASN
jgi:predicted protein tyrosine phosphatase